MKKLALTVAILCALPAGAAFKCIDERGATLIADTPPPGCAKVPMFEVSPSGHVVRRIEPTPTPEQLKALEEQRRRDREAEKVAAEQRRKDNALLATFATEKEFDFALDRNIEPIANRIRSAQERIKAVDQRLAKLDEEMDFYKSGASSAKARARGKDKEQAAQPEVPHSLLSEQERLQKEKSTLEANIGRYESEIVAQRARFDADKKRWIELKRTGGYLETSAPSARKP